MKQVKNETAIYHLAVALKAYDDANPEVGMGPSYGYFVDQAGRQLGLEPSDYDARHIEDLMKANSR